MVLALGFDKERLIKRVQRGFLRFHNGRCKRLNDRNPVINDEQCCRTDWLKKLWAENHWPDVLMSEKDQREFEKLEKWK